MGSRLLWIRSSCVVVLAVVAFAVLSADEDRPIALRGFSWIVNPFETGGVVIAIEMTLGAAVAGPFDVPEARLTAMIDRVVNPQRTLAPTTVH